MMLPGMKSHFKMVKLIAALAVAAGIGWCAWITYQASTLTSEKVEKRLLKDLPIGSSSETVLAYLQQHTGRKPFFATNFHTWERDPADAGAKSVDKYYAGLAVASVNKMYGLPSGPLFVEVGTHWEFDSNLRLTRLKVTLD